MIFSVKFNVKNASFFNFYFIRQNTKVLPTFVVFGSLISGSMKKRIIKVMLSSKY